MKKKKELDCIQSIRFSSDQFNLVRTIAEIQTHNSGIHVSCHELIRSAVQLVFEDGEWLRECFRRTRKSQTSRWFKSAKKR